MLFIFNNLCYLLADVKIKVKLFSRNTRPITICHWPNFPAQLLFLSIWRNAFQAHNIYITCKFCSCEMFFYTLSSTGWKMVTNNLNPVDSHFFCVVFKNSNLICYIFQWFSTLTIHSITWERRALKNVSAPASTHRNSDCII